MIADRKRKARSAEERRRDRKARSFGAVYLLVAAGLAMLHDEVLTLPINSVTHAGEQATLAGMLVLGMLGGLLMVEGGRPFDDAYALARRRKFAGEGAMSATGPGAGGTASATAPAAFDSSVFDTRSGVAMLLARRAITAAAVRRASGPATATVPDTRIAG